MNQMVGWWRRWQRHWYADIRYMISAADTYTDTTAVRVIYISVGLSFDALQPLSPPIYVENRSDYPGPCLNGGRSMAVCNGCLHMMGIWKKKKMREIHLFPALSICLSRGKKLNGTHGIMSLVKYCFVVDDFTTFCLIDINGPVCSVHHCVGWIRTEITQLKGLTSLHPSFGAFAWRLGIADHRAPNCPICPFNRRVESEVELGKCFLAAASIFTVFYDENRCVCW